MVQGQIPRRAEIEAISNALPCVITTTEDHGYASYDFVRLTNLGVTRQADPPNVVVQNGADELNNNRYRIIVTGLDTYQLQDPITFEFVDSTAYPPYNGGGKCNLIVHDYIFHPPED